MNLIIERQCDQCGGAMEIQETDTGIECPWCGVRHFMDTGEARYILPHKDLAGELIHVPYLRLKGSLFTCDLDTIHHKVIDTTVEATGINALPHTLGLRPQTLKLQFASDALHTTYLNHSMQWQDAIDQAATVQDLTQHKPKISQWIGETFSTIYQPLIIQNNFVLDGVTGQNIAKLPKNKDIFAKSRLNSLGWQVNLLPTLCPNCGWDMQSDQASIIHFCTNCSTGWRNRNGVFSQVEFSMVHSNHPDTIYLPFWQMQVDFAGIDLQSLADFITITNIPRHIKPEWHDAPLNFFCPAFKIRPKILLRVASQLTASQQPLIYEPNLPENMFPVSLAAQDAKEAIKLILGNSAVAKRNIMPILDDIVIKAVQSKLVFLPFFDNGYELCQEKLKITINKQILEWGKRL